MLNYVIIYISLSLLDASNSHRPRSVCLYEKVLQLPFNYYERCSLIQRYFCELYRYAGKEGLR